MEQTKTTDPDILSKLQQQRESGNHIPIYDRPYVPNQSAGRLSFSPLNKYDEGLRTDMNQDRLRYLNQTNTQAWGNAAVQSIGEIVLGTLEGFTVLADLPQYASVITGSEKEFSNGLGNIFKNTKQSLNEKFPIYDSGEEFSAKSLIDGRFWASNMSSVASSLSLIAPSAAVLKGLSGIKKLQTLGNALNLTDDAVRGLKGITGAVTSRYLESYLEAGEALQSNYERLIAEGNSIEDAKNKAGEIAANVYYANWVNLITDIPQYTRLFSKVGAARALEDAVEREVKMKTFKGIFGETLKTSLSEGLEEGVQYGIQQVAPDSKGGFDTILNVLAKSPELIKEKEFWESFTLGAAGGAIFEGLGPSVAKLTDVVLRKKRDELSNVPQANTQQNRTSNPLPSNPQAREAVQRQVDLHEVGDRTLADAANNVDDPSLAQAARDEQRRREILNDQQREYELNQRRLGTLNEFVDNAANEISTANRSFTKEDILKAANQQARYELGLSETGNVSDLTGVDPVKFNKLVEHYKDVINFTQTPLNEITEESIADEEEDTRFNLPQEEVQQVPKTSPTPTNDIPEEGIKIRYNNEEYIAKKGKGIFIELFDPNTGKSTGRNILKSKLNTDEVEVLTSLVPEESQQEITPEQSQESVQQPEVVPEAAQEPISPQKANTPDKDNKPSESIPTKVKGKLGSNKDVEFTVSPGANPTMFKITDNKGNSKLVSKTVLLRDFDNVSDTNTDANKTSSKPETTQDVDAVTRPLNIIEEEVTEPEVEEDERKISIVNKILGLFYISPSGKVDESKKDLLDPDLLANGEEVTLEVVDDDTIPYGNTTWGEAKKKMSPDEIIENIPIKIFKGDKFIGYVPATSWIRKKYNIPDAIDKSVKLRTAIYSKKKVKSTIIHRTFGHLNTVNEAISVNEALPKGKLVVKGNLNIKSEDGNVPVNITEKSMNRTYISLEVNGLNVAYPLDETELTNDIKRSFTEVLNIYASYITGQQLTTVQENIVKEFKKLGYDLSNAQDVESYIRLYSYTVSKTSPFHRTPAPHIQITKKGIYFDTKEGKRFNVVNLKNKTYSKKSIDDIVARSKTSTNEELFDKKGVTFPYLSESNEVLYYKKDYVEEVRSRTVTKIRPINLDNGKTVYHYNPEVYFSRDIDEFVPDNIKEESVTSVKVDTDFAEQVKGLGLSWANNVLDAPTELGYPPVFIEGVSTKDMFDLVKLIGSDIFKKLLSQNKITGPEIKEVIEKSKSAITLFASERSPLNTSKKQALTKVLENWETLEGLILLYMSKRQNVKVNDDLNIEDLIEDGNEEGVRFDFSDDYSFTIDFRNTITGELKKLLSTIPSKNKNFLGVQTYEDLDMVYNTLSSVLVMETGENEIPTWERTREKLVNADLPFNILELLDSSTDSVKNQFTSLFNKHYLNMSFVMWQENKVDDQVVGYSFFPTESSRNGIRFYVSDSWEANARAKNNFDAVLLAIENKESPEEIFEKLGISVSQEAIKQLSEKRSFAKTKSTGLNWHYTHGVFKQLADRIKLIKENNNESLFDQSILKAFISIESQYRPNMYNSSFASGNLMISGFANPRGVINRLSQLKRESFREILKRLPFSKVSHYLKNWINEEVVYTYVDIANVLKRRNSKSKLKRRLVDLSPKEIEEFKLAQFFNNGTDKANFLYPTMSDKTFAVMLSFAKERFSIPLLFEQVVLPELMRMKFAQNGITDNYKPNLFYFIPQLNEPGIYEKLIALLPNLNDKGELVGIYDLKDIESKLQEVIDSLVTKRLEYWKKNKVNIDSRALKKSDKKALALQYEFNYLLFNANMHMLFIGDPAIYYKSSPTKSKIQQVWDTFINIGKRLAGDAAPRLSQTVDKNNNIRYIFLKDVYGISENIKDITRILDKKEITDKEIKEIEDSLNTDSQKETIKKYSKLYPNSAPYFSINTTDAQEYTTKEEHVNVLLQYGKISNSEAEYLLSKDEFTEEELGKYFQPLLAQKPVYVGNHVMNDTIDQRFYVKSSSIPLLKELTEGQPLDKLRIYMETNKVNRAAYESAVKVGLITPVSLDNLESGTPIDLPRENFGIQLELPYDENKKKVKRGTQASKLLFVNILQYFKKEKKEYDRLHKELLNAKKQSFVNEFYNKDGSINKEKIADILRKEAQDRGYSYFEILALKMVAGEFKFPLFAISPRIESLLISIFNKRNGEIKFPGKSYVLVSEAYLNSKSKNVIYTKDFTGKLKADEVILPWIFGENNINDFLDEDGYLDIDKVPEELLKLVGFRIPTQGHNSMRSLKIVGFLPPIYQDMIIASKDLITQMGSDFDIDKLITYMYDYEVGSDGKLRRVIKGEKGITNKIIDIHHKVLQSEEVKPLLYKPLDYGRFPEVIEDKLDEDFVPLSEGYQTSKFINASYGKSGVGSFSLDSVFNAIIQGHSLELEDASITFGNKTWDGNFDLPVGKRTPYEIISAYQSASVDNEKEQILDKVDVNRFTFPVARILNQAGFEEDVAYVFLNQPIIKEYVEKSLQGVKNVYDVLTDKYKLNTEDNKISDEQAKLADVDVDILKSYIDNPNTLEQRAILDKFIKLVGYGSTVQSVQTAVNTDSAGLPKSVIGINTKVEKLSRIGFLLRNAFNILGKVNTEGNGVEFFRTQDQVGSKKYYLDAEGISGLYSAMLLEAKVFLNKIFPLYSTKSFLSILAKQSEIEERDLTNEEMETLKKEFISYIYTGFYKNQGIKKYREELLKNLGKEILNLQKITNNLFIQKLKVKYEDGNYLIEYNSASREDFDDIMIVAAFEEVMNVYPQIGRKLIDYHFLTSGQQQAREYIKYINPEHIQDLADYLNGIDFNRIPVDEFIKQYNDNKLDYYSAESITKQTEDDKEISTFTLREYLFELYNNSSDKEFSKLAELILPYLDNQNILFRLTENLSIDGRLVPGKATLLGNNTILLELDDNQIANDYEKAKVILHEVFHGVSAYALRSNKARKIRDMFDEFKQIAKPKTTQQKYMLSSLDEFVTMFMTSKEHRDWVDSHKLDSSTTYKNKFIRIFVELFNDILKHFGFQSKFSEELFNEIIDLLDDYGKSNTSIPSSLLALANEAHKNC